MADDLKVFILGSPRSGTSITYYAMREVFGLKGRGEGHVFPIFERMLHQFYLYTKDFSEKHKGVLAGELDVRMLREAFHAYLRAFYTKAYGAGGFVDKTPGAEIIRGAGLIYGAFPDAKVILLQRNGIEVINSYQSKFGASFESACQAWAHVMAASERLVREQPGVLVVDQFDLTNTPDVAAGRICAHLGRLDLAEAVANFFAERRVEQQSAHDWTKRVTLADVAWEDAQKSFFQTTCGEAMSRLGYV